MYLTYAKNGPIVLVMRLSGLLTCFALICCWSAAQAGVVITPHPGFEDPPKYFSGTNSRAHYYAEVTNGSYITYAWLTIGGHIVWQTPPPQPWPRQVVYYNAGPVVMFDASKFNHMDMVEVKLHLYVDGQLVEHSYQTIAKCQADAWSDPDFPSQNGGNGVSVAAQKLGSMNYQTQSFTNHWTVEEFLERFYGSIIYVNAHGEPQLHRDGDMGSVSFIQSSSFDLLNYVAGRNQRNGYGLPPYNSTGNPPINLLSLDCCNTGDDNTASSALLPFYNVYSSTACEDQAVHTYSVFTRLGDSEAMARIIYDQLQAGKSILQASTYLIVHAEDEDIKCSDDDPGPYRFMSLTTDRAILGDISAKIKNAYDGSTAQSMEWFRVVG